MTIPRLAPTGRFYPEALFHPTSVAVIGAETTEGARVHANLALGRFDGSLQAVERVDELARAPDLAVIACERGAVAPAMEGLAAKGGRAAILLGQHQADPLVIAALVRRTGVRVLGPHSFGLAVPAIGLNATLSHIEPPAGRLALVSQSSALCRALIDWAEPNGLGFSHIIGVGGNADLGFGPALDWLSRDAGTGAILLDIRRIKDRRRFLSAARAAARLRPVVAIQAGLRAVDPDSMADVVFEAALRRAGVLTVPRLVDLLAAAETLSRARPPVSERLSIIGNAQGPVHLVMDSLVRLGLKADAACTVVPTRALEAAATRALSEADLGSVLVVHAPSGPDDDAAIAGLAALAPKLRTPLLVCAMGETTGTLRRAQLARAGVPVFAMPEQAALGFFHLVQDRRNRAMARELPPSAVLSVAPDQECVRKVFRAVRREGRPGLAQDEALDVLSAYGIPVAPTRRVMTSEDAARAGALFGFPVVVKLRQSVPPHARIRTGLTLDLRRAEDVGSAAATLLGQPQVSGKGGGLLVQRQAGRARELAVRMTEDATFGPAIGFGAGGTAPDAARDHSVDLPPLNLALARSLIGRNRTGRHLNEALRDRPAGNLEAVSEVLVRVSQLILDFPEIMALEVPSLFTDPLGVVVADAWIGLRPDGAAPGLLSIAPYPVELVTRHTFGDKGIVVRPIRPEDAAAHGRFFSRLSPEDVRYRFFSAIRVLSDERLVRLTEIDYDREMAFVAVQEATQDTVGVSRLVCDPDTQSGEFAVIVQPDMKGQGLAGLLMRRLLDWARSRGLQTVVGQVLADNAPMLSFVRHMGFTVHRMADEPEVMEVRLGLAAE